MFHLIRHVLILSVLAVTAVSVPAQTASRAVSVVLKQYGSAYGQRLVAVTGLNGSHQPAEWHVFAYDLKTQGTISHWVLAGGKITAAAMLDAQRSRQWAAPVLPWDRVKVDSDAAFKIADATARQAAVGFDSLGYRLMTDRRSGAAVWLLELADSRGKTVGSLRIDAVHGTVLSQSWGKGGFGADRFDWKVVKQEMNKIGHNIGSSWQRFKQDVRNTLGR